MQAYDKHIYIYACRACMVVLSCFWRLFYAITFLILIQLLSAVYESNVVSGSGKLEITFS